jgi:hypothetical protein
MKVEAVLVSHGLRKKYEFFSVNRNQIKLEVQTNWYIKFMTDTEEQLRSTEIFDIISNFIIIII